MAADDHSLTLMQTQQLEATFQQFSDCIGKVQGQTDQAMFEIDIYDARPIAQKPYFKPRKWRDQVQQDIDKLLDIWALSPLLIAHGRHPLYLLLRRRKGFVLY